MISLLCLLSAALAEEPGDEGAVVIRLGGEVISAEAASAEPPVSRAALITVDVQEADIRSVMRLFSEVSGLNFILTDNVQGVVTAHLTDVPWDTALAAILYSEGLAMQQMGTVAVIEPVGH